MTEQRFFIGNGYQFVDSHDNTANGFQIDVGKVNMGDDEVFIEMIRSPKASHLGAKGFMIARVFVKESQEEKDLWNFSWEKRPGLMGRLVEYKDQLVIILIQGNRIEKAILLTDVPHLHLVEIDGKMTTTGGSGSKVTLEVKMSIAEKMGIKYNPVGAEVALLRLWKQRMEAEAEAKAETKAKAAEEREAAKKAKVKAILARPRLFGLTSDYRKRNGTPVTEEEYPMLPDGTWVVLVPEYVGQMELTGEAESFVVNKTGGGKTKKGGLVTIYPAKIIEKETAPLLKAERSFFISLDGEDDIREVLVFASKEQVVAARKQGLNSGTLVAIDSSREDGRYQVLALENGQQNPIGLFSPLA